VKFSSFLLPFFVRSSGFAALVLSREKTLFFFSLGLSFLSVTLKVCTSPFFLVFGFVPCPSPFLQAALFFLVTGDLFFFLFPFKVLQSLSPFTLPFARRIWYPRPLLFFLLGSFHRGFPDFFLVPSFMIDVLLSGTPPFPFPMSPPFCN